MAGVNLPPSVGPEERNDMETYLNESGVSAILKELVIRVCRQKPEKPIRFMRDYLEQRIQEEDDKFYDKKQEEPEEMAVDEGPPPEFLKNRRRRGAVSSEPAGEVEAIALDIPHNRKDEETNARLDNALQKHILCSHLDENERREIFDAMTEVFFEKGTVIIQQGV
jgi:cAMP-dependent protein kinase regulator